MQSNFRLKDLTDISIKVPMCKIGDKFNVSAYTNTLEGDINAFIRIDNSEDGALGRTVLFSFRSGEQLSTTDLSYEEQLIIPQEDLDNLKSSLAVTFTILSKTSSVWGTIIDKVNGKHVEDKNNNFTTIPSDLPIPDFRYVKPEKKSFFSKLKDIIKK